MKTALVIVLAAAALGLVWVFGLTLNLLAGFGVLVLAAAAERIHTDNRRATRRAGEHVGSIVAMPEREQHHERSRAA